MIASPEMQKYFEDIKKEVLKIHSVASLARKKGFDPVENVEIVIAENMAERVVGLISVVAPQILDAREQITARIVELEKQYGTLDWRIALKIAEEIAQEKFCKFKDKKEAMEIGIRTGFAYVTVGVVSSPLDGFVDIDIKKRMDNRGEYFCVNLAGPIRNAGGTAAAVCLLIADYVRKCFGYDVYDAQELEIKRSYTEMQDYRERVAPRQYFPSFAEIEFLLQRFPIEVGGEPSEKFEVSNYKDLPRIPTNLVRSGFCLVLTECIPLKAPKLWKQLGKWGKDFGMDHWNFLEKYLELQKKVKAKETSSSEKSSAKIKPDYSYISDIVAGRPVLSHPMRVGGFRIRYGRSRTSGYSSCGVHPATMFCLRQYLATGTQLKLERPAKGTAITACDSIEGPVVKLEDGSVLQVDSLKKAKELSSKITEIIFLGDLLVNYGDFFNRAHPLIPAGYCPEWWSLEFEKAAKDKGFSFAELAGFLDSPVFLVESLLKHPLHAKITSLEAISFAKKLDIPLHPDFTYFWSTISKEQFLLLLQWFEKWSVLRGPSGEIEKIVLPNNDALAKQAKRVLEVLGVPHLVVNKEFVVVEKQNANALIVSLGLDSRQQWVARQMVQESPETSVLNMVNQLSSVKIRDKSGIFIGARMGRPEKAKMRKMKGSPHVLFPVGDEGGKMRNFSVACTAGRVSASFPVFFCESCKQDTVLAVCEQCSQKTKQFWSCRYCGKIESSVCQTHGPALPYKAQEIPIGRFMKSSLNRLQMKAYPEVIKGVRGTSNKDHVPERLEKGLLRAKHELYVNKDGTIRYDMTQLPITHFKPREIETPVQRLIELGYTKDIYGSLLTSDDQILELKPQDIVLPDCDQSPDEGSAAVLLRTAKFVDELAVKFYGVDSVYGFSSQKDLIGALVVCLAPHTSAGIVGRIIGFSRTQGFFAHPLLHAATRRDCDGDEACVTLLFDAFLNFSRRFLPSTRGATMDAPLVLTVTLLPSEVDDMAFDVDRAARYPLELYEASLAFKMPWDVKVSQLKECLNTPQQYEGSFFTHDISDMNATVRCSAYKTLPTMEEKLMGQMAIAEAIRAVDTSDVASLVIDKHFLKDTKGNLRKFGTQEVRCVNCNDKFRRPPLIGKCTSCSGKLLFTVSEGSVVKYVELAVELANKYDVSAYTKQVLELLQQRIEGVFGKVKEKQTGLAMFAEPKEKKQEGLITV